MGRRTSQRALSWTHDLPELTAGPVLGGICLTRSMLGDLAEAEQAAELFARVTRSSGDLWVRSGVNVLALNYLRVQQGRWRDAARVALEGIRLAAMGEDHFTESVGWARYAQTQAVLGEVEETLQSLARASLWPTSKSAPTIRQAIGRARGILHLYVGELEESRRILEAVGELQLDVISLRATNALQLCDVLAEMQDWPALQRTLKPWTARLDGYPVLKCWVVRLQGRLAAGRGDRRGAEASLRRSIQDAEKLGARTHHGRALGYLARLNGDEALLEKAAGLLRSGEDRLGLKLLRLTDAGPGDPRTPPKEIQPGPQAARPS